MNETLLFQRFESLCKINLKISVFKYGPLKFVNPFLMKICVDFDQAQQDSKDTLAHWVRHLIYVHTTCLRSKFPIIIKTRRA